MTRLLGEPQNPRVFWLVLLLAMMLLVGISAAPANAAAAGERSALAREIGVLLALGEALQRPGLGRIASPIHPELADGGSEWLKNTSARRVRSLQRKLADFADQDPPGALERQRLSVEADRLHWELLAFQSGGDEGLRLARSLARLGAVQPAVAAGAEGLAVEAEAPARLVRILRGTGL